MAIEPPPSPLLPSNALSASLSRALAARDQAVAIMVSSAHCPWCGLVIQEQLIPRIRAKTGPRLEVVVFDLSDTTPVRLAVPSGPALRLSPQAWAQAHRYRVAPTLVMVGSAAQPLFGPLVGYSSRDFYGAYLDDQVERAQRYWSQHA
ncbi:MAG: hypothetical protein RLZZ344_1264 [Pseudomonadota bacterium]|jgi:thioredoxin-related protein